MEVAGRRAFWNDRIGGGGRRGKGMRRWEGKGSGVGGHTYAAQFLTNCRPGKRRTTQCDAA